MIKSAYLDTSVFGGYFDEEFSEPTVSFFERIIRDEIDLIISEVLTAELQNAPEHVRKLLDLIPSNQIKTIDVSLESEKLAKHYVSEKVVGKTSYADCLHIALATLSYADILVSWNFKHIVNIDRIRGYNSVNIKLGYKMIEIHSPLELGTYE
jgi:predicted nucleic acid-binding protein